MREITTTGLGKIQFPNALHYVFDSAMIRFYDLPEGLTGVHLTIFTTDGQSYTEERERFADEVVFDISRYLQMIFSGRDFTRSITNDEDNLQDSPTYWPRVSVAASPLMGASWDGSLSTEWTNGGMGLVWGGLQLGEVGLGCAPRRWWKGYPFTLDFWLASGAEVNAVENGQQIGSVTAPYDGLFLLDMMEVYPTITSTTQVSAPSTIIINDMQSAAFTAYNVEVRDCGVDFEGKRYLRWIDGQGRYCYWLFDVLSTIREVSATAWADYTMQRSNYYLGGVNENSTVRQAMTNATSVQLVTRNLEEWYYPLLLSLCSSPIVEVFDGYDSGDTTVPLWHRVNIVAGSYTKLTKKHCEDFGVTITEATYNTQMR